jgi:flagellar biosynthesis/type III secretory pathway protein FliH
MSRQDVEQAAEQTVQIQTLRQQAEKAASLCKALQKAVGQIEQISKDLFVSHRESIVRLSLEIAAKILAKDIHQRNYDMEAIVLQAMQNLPPAQRITLRLHPEDLAIWQEAAGHDQMTAPENILCIGDWSVGKAECIVETDQGVVEYLIEEQLKQVATALLGHETSMESAR